MKIWEQWKKKAENAGEKLQEYVKKYTEQKELNDQLIKELKESRERQYKLSVERNRLDSKLDVLRAEITAALTMSYTEESK